MVNIPRLIRLDREFCASVEEARVQLSAKSPLPVIINGLSGGAQDAYITEAAGELCSGGAPVLILVPNDAERHRLAELLTESGLRAREYKPRELVFHNISASHDLDRERLSVLFEIISGTCEALVTTPTAALGMAMPPELLESLSLSFSLGEELPPATLAEGLVSLGFARVDMVEAAGQFSVRGDIVDIWHVASELPARVEFFGDEIDRIATFDPDTQRSVDSIERLTLLPAREVIADAEGMKRVLTELERLIKGAPSEEARMKLEAERALVAAGILPESRDRFLSLIYKKGATLFDYLDLHTRVAVFVVGTNEVRDAAKRAVSLMRECAAALVEDGLISKERARYILAPEELEKFTERSASIHLNPFAGGVGNMRAAGLYGIRCRRTTSYGGNGSLLIDDVRAFRSGLYRTLILTDTRQGADSLVESLLSEDIHARAIYDTSDFDLGAAQGGSVLVDVGKSSGFELLSPRVAVLSMERPEGRAVMEKRRQARILKRIGGAGKRLMSHADLSVGDYVVHANYGIGMFEGIEAVSIDGVVRDYITIRYAGTDKLFVPCDKLEMIGKYIGQKDSDGKVRLSKMGGGDWHRAKSRAKSAAKDIARDLIRLYAERQRLPGFAFPPDSELEDEFAASFDYEETVSQLVAIEEIKADMMKPVPMNRLLLGDVGFGKTEVALRAAFKAIMGGKQVAILVPTTILALQHFTTATSRMRGYPVTVEMISRFKSPKEQEKIIRRAARGEIDILIGTHKLLSGRVSFRDLGLLIIDEEQRFGVAQKEKLREMAKNVDTLTLSATPIPRTLNMAMNGISDMSILDEAPGERRPVQTYVLEYDEAIVYDAMRRELLRGGQVLYLYNRIEDIDLVATRILKAIPEARLAIAHGAMDKDELEDIWQSLVRCEIDILVCTTIVETGIDLPLANTLIIEGADRMGLSQLHQLRGRVGRSERQAYAYFTFRPGKALTDVARKRLDAIRDYATFGAGFKVAMRDLEIRGAGNLLGAEQHGYIESVGYDLYVKLLEEAVLEERGMTPETLPDATVDIRVSANIPDRYISVSAQRMEMYKKISLIRDRADMEDIIDEFIDRFGEMPRETDTLVKVSLVRALATRARMKRVEHSSSVLLFHSDKPDLAVWSELFAAMPELSFRAGAVPIVSYRLKKGETPVDAAVRVMVEYTKIMNEEGAGRNGK